MAREAWRTMPFDQAVQVNPPVHLERGRVYPFVDMQAVAPSSRTVGPSDYREFEGGGSRFGTGDTLMARITPCLENGKIARFRADEVDAVGHGSTEFIVIRGRPRLTENDFAYYLTRWDGVRGYAISQMTGSSGRQRVPTTALSHLEVSIPPLAEQRAIAAVLGALDDKIELNRRMCRTLEGIARAIFQAWFVDFLPVRAKAAGAKSFRGMPQAVFDTLPTQFANSPLGPIPKGWSVGTLGEHIEAVKGLSYKGSGLCDGGIPLHNLNSVHEGGGYKYEGIKYYDGEYRDRHVIRPGDIIVTNTEQGHDLLLIGYPAIVPRRFGDWGLFSHHLFRVRPKPESPVTRHFVYFMLMAPRVRDEITGHTNGTTVNMLSVTGLQMPLLVVPPRTVLDAYEAIASPLLERAEQTHDQSPTLAAIRDALLPKLVSGELRIRDVERIIGRCA